MCPPGGIVLISFHGRSKDQTQVAGTNQRLAVLFVRLGKNLTSILRTSCPLFCSSTNNIMGSGAGQRGTKCVSEYASPLIAPILSVRSGHFLSAGRSQGREQRASQRGWQTELALMGGTELKARVSFQAMFHFLLSSLP